MFSISYSTNYASCTSSHLRSKKKISRNGFFFFFELSCFLLLSLFYEVILFIYIFLGVLYSTRDLSFPARMEPTPHSVEGGVLTTGPPGKSQNWLFKNRILSGATLLLCQFCFWETIHLVRESEFVRVRPHPKQSLEEADTWGQISL